ncbi:MAG: MTAP family purine nucleoside phosphorylase [Armatimonadetes bacterium]|nr:MTAP family purine nucleoside phosphorylase [Armatimonadota bacterium]
MPKSSLNDKLAVIGGSQGFRTVEKLGKAGAIDPVPTPFGPSAPIHTLEVGGNEVYFLSRHGESGYRLTAPFVNYRANIWALKELGVARIVAWSGPGAIDPGIPIGDILVPDDIIDETRGRACTFYENLGIGFIRQNPVFCPDLSASLRTAIESRQGHCRVGDVYVCTQGPRLETRAEIRKFASYGATLVGMTLVPEAFLAKELEMCYCPVCYITNYAEGVVERSYRPGELFEGLLSSDEMAKVDSAVQALPEIAIEALLKAGTDRECKCGLSMERYRKRGDIGDDWRTWIREVRSKR